MQAPHAKESFLRRGEEQVWLYLACEIPLLSYLAELCSIPQLFEIMISFIFLCAQTPEKVSQSSSFRIARSYVVYDGTHVVNFPAANKD